MNRAAPWLLLIITGMLLVGVVGGAASSALLAPRQADGVLLRPAYPTAANAVALSITAFGADRTGVEAADGALRAAIAAAVASGNRSVHLPAGIYRVNGQVTIPAGIMLVGEGSQGSNEARGTVIKHYSTGDCLVWDGSGPEYAGTGGGLRDILIVKADGYQGGTAIRLVARDDSHRPGEMLFDNVLVYGVGATIGKAGRGGLWAHGLVVDGSAARTSGSIGVRSVHLNKTRFAEAITPNETLVLNQATHFFAQGLQIDAGDSRAPQGVTLKGANDAIFFTSADIGGSVIVTANDADNHTSDFHLTGKIAAVFDNRDSQLTGTMSASFDRAGRYVLRNRSGDLAIRSNINPDFALAIVRPGGGVTGDGSSYPIVFDTKDRDRGNNFGAMPVNEFVCMAAGRYLFVVSATLSGVTVAHRRADLSIDQAGSVARSHVATINPGALQAGGFVTIEKTVILELAAGDRVRAVVSVAGGPRSVGVFGAAGRYSTLAGQYLE
ncbi:glycosyl hydrolase family 28-related protein [Sphingomonas melonis]|uniref:glycosyl hydrolase family 28-related protein n=2 Tax=Sphingomonas melonis TaxID=152682 RepID=UPI0018D310AA|nr:glycosyl hydrolase family 28-related protein [Sphingomonas melonis]